MRSRCDVIVLGPDGRPLAGASVMTNRRPSGEAAAVYAAETGEGAGSNPATSDVTGEVVQWCERGAYSSTITAEGMEPKVVPWDSAPAGDHGVDHNWLTVLMQEAVDAVPGLIATTATYAAGTHAARPAAAGGPDIYLETDTGDVFFNKAGAWAFVVPAGSITDAMVAANRALLVTNGTAVSRTEYAVGAVIPAPSGTLMTWVDADIQMNPGTSGDTSTADLYVGGVHRKQLSQSGTEKGGEVRLPFGFICPPGATWEVKGSASYTPSSLHASYLPF